VTLERTSPAPRAISWEASSTPTTCEAMSRETSEAWATRVLASWTPTAASPILRAMSRVTTVCSSRPAAMQETISLRRARDAAESCSGCAAASETMSRARAALEPISRMVAVIWPVP